MSPDDIAFLKAAVIAAFSVGTGLSSDDWSRGMPHLRVSWTIESRLRSESDARPH